MNINVHEPVKPTDEPPMRCVFGWHLYWRHEGMMGDRVVTCVNCGATRYTNLFINWIYNITGRITHEPVVWDGHKYVKASKFKGPPVSKEMYDKFMEDAEKWKDKS